MEIIILGGSRTGNSSLAKSIKSKLQSDMDTGVMKADEITVSTGFDMLSVIDPVYTIIPTNEVVEKLATMDHKPLVNTEVVVPPVVPNTITVKNLLDQMVACCPVKVYVSIGNDTDRLGVRLMWIWYICDKEYSFTQIVKPTEDIDEALAYSKRSINQMIDEVK